MFASTKYIQFCIFTDGRGRPSLRVGYNFAFCVFIRFGRADPSPTGGVDFEFYILHLFGRTVEDARPYGGNVNFAFCILRLFREGGPLPYGMKILLLLGGRSGTPVPTRVVAILHFAFCIYSAHSGVDSNSSLWLVLGWLKER